MKTVFIDTSYLLALELANDGNHEAATQHWNGMANALPHLVTTSYVFDEVVTFLNNRKLHSKAAQVGQWLLTSPSMQMLHVDETLFHLGWEYVQNHADKDYSLTDCISFVVMQRLSIDTAFAFDRHFTQAGFMKEP